MLVATSMVLQARRLQQNLLLHYCSTLSIVSLASVKGLFRWLSEADESQSCYDLYVRATWAGIDGCVSAASFQKKITFCI